MKHFIHSPALLRPALLCVVLICTASLAKAADLTQAEFEKLHKQLQPSPDEPWRTIPWKISLLDAQAAAAEQQKPIFIWAMDGHPLGCTWNNGVLDRESTFADPEIIKLLQTRFIPVAIDQAYQRRQQDAEGEYYRQIASQGPRHDFKNGTTQGLYVATADGKFLAYTNNRGPERVKQTIEKALSQFKPVKTAAIDPGKLDERWHPQPPQGGLIVRVRAKVLDGYEESDDPWRQIFQSSLSRDNLWISKSEHQDLVNGKVADSLARRIAKYHLIDNTRGEPPMWDDGEIRSVDLQLKDGQLTGSVRLETKSGDRGYDAQLFGIVETTDGQVTRFDVVAKGDFWGEGTYTRGAPKGKFPLGISFTLADGTDTADAVPPQASRGWLRGYIQ